MDDSERMPQRRVIAVSAQFQVFEHEESLLAGLSSTQRDGNSGAGRGKRREAVSLGGETVECRAAVCLGEVPATAALEYEATMDATSRDGCRALDSKRARDI